jgi:hypothetical protein
MTMGGTVAGGFETARGAGGGSSDAMSGAGRSFGMEEMDRKCDGAFERVSLKEGSGITAFKFHIRNSVSCPLLLSTGSQEAHRGLSENFRIVSCKTLANARARSQWSSIAHRRLQVTMQRMMAQLQERISKLTEAVPHFMAANTAL